MQTDTERAAAKQLESTHAVATISSSPAEASVPSEREQSLEAPRQAQQALESFTRTKPVALSALEAAAFGERVALEAAAAQLAAAREEVSAACSMLLLEQPAAESAREEAVASATVGAKSESRAALVSATLELRAAETLDECERALPIRWERMRARARRSAGERAAAAARVPQAHHGAGRTAAALTGKQTAR